MFIIVEVYFVSASTNSTGLSAKRRYDGFVETLPTLIGFQRLRFIAWLIKRVRDSMQMINKYSERGSPCLIPRVGLKEVVGFPLTSIHTDEVVTHDIMSEISFGGKFKLAKENLMKDHSRRSNAFSRSIFSIICPFLLLFLLKE